MNNPKSITVFGKVTSVGNIEGQSFKQVGLKTETGERHLAIVNTTIGEELVVGVVGTFSIAQHLAYETEYVGELGAPEKHKQSNSVITTFLLESASQLHQTISSNTGSLLFIKLLTIILTIMKVNKEAVVFYGSIGIMITLIILSIIYS